MLRHLTLTLTLSSALALSSALSLSTLPAFAQAPDELYTASHQQLEVTKVILAQQDAWNLGHLDDYLSSYKDADDTLAILATPERGLKNIRAAFHLNFPNRESMGTLEDSEVEVRALGPNFALATGHYRLTRSRKAGGDATGLFTDVLQKTAAGWQIIFSENT